MRRFPAYKTADEVTCFSCQSTQMGLKMDTGSPHGMGRWRKTCRRCGYHTYFDLDRRQDRVEEGQQ